MEANISWSCLQILKTQFSRQIKKINKQMVWLSGTSPKHAVMYLIMDHQPVLRVQGKQPILLQALTCPLLSWEFALFPITACWAGPDWRCAQTYSTLKARMVAHSCPILCSAQLSPSEAQWMFSGAHLVCCVNCAEEVRVLASAETLPWKTSLLLLPSFHRLETAPKIDEEKKCRLIIF